MKKKAINGAAVAVAAVSIALAGGVSTPAKATSPAGNVRCFGVNSCKGKSDCHTPKNACKGSNSCKAQGWLYVETAKACEDANGRVLD